MVDDNLLQLKFPLANRLCLGGTEPGSTITEYYVYMYIDGKGVEKYKITHLLVKLVAFKNEQTILVSYDNTF
jgi:hypothetical protein